MRCFQIAIAVFVGVSQAWADNLPPVPKTIPVTVSAIVAPKGDLASTPTVESPVRSVAEAPLPTTPVKAKAVCSDSLRRPIAPAVAFLGDELLRKPIYVVQKAFADLEGWQLCRANRRLAAQEGECARKANELAVRQMSHQQRVENLKAKRAELFGGD